MTPNDVPTTTTPRRQGQRQSQLKRRQRRRRRQRLSNLSSLSIWNCVMLFLLFVSSSIMLQQQRQRHLVRWLPSQPNSLYFAQAAAASTTLEDNTSDDNDGDDVIIDFDSSSIATRRENHDDNSGEDVVNNNNNNNGGGAEGPGDVVRNDEKSGVDDDNNDGISDNGIDAVDGDSIDDIVDDRDDDTAVDGLTGDNDDDGNDEVAGDNDVKKEEEVITEEEQGERPRVENGLLVFNDYDDFSNITTILSNSSSSSSSSSSPYSSSSSLSPSSSLSTEQLLLLVIYDQSSCPQHSQNLLRTVEHTSVLLEDRFQRLLSHHHHHHHHQKKKSTRLLLQPTLASLPIPLLGKLERTSFLKRVYGAFGSEDEDEDGQAEDEDEEGYLAKTLKDGIDHVPTLMFVLLDNDVDGIGAGMGDDDSSVGKNNGTNTDTDTTTDMEDTTMEQPGPPKEEEEQQQQPRKGFSFGSNPRGEVRSDNDDGGGKSSTMTDDDDGVGSSSSASSSLLWSGKIKKIKVIDYVGPTNKPSDIADTVIHLWYRLVVSTAMMVDDDDNGHKIRDSNGYGTSDDDGSNGNSNTKDSEATTGGSHDDDNGDVGIVERPHRPIFPVRNMDELIEFVEGYGWIQPDDNEDGGGGLFHMVEQDLEMAGGSIEEEDYIRRLLDFSGNSGYGGGSSCSGRRTTTTTSDNGGSEDVSRGNGDCAVGKNGDGTIASVVSQGAGKDKEGNGKEELLDKKEGATSEHTTESTSHSSPPSQDKLDLDSDSDSIDAETPSPENGGLKPKRYDGGGFDEVEGEEEEDLRDPFIIFLQCRRYIPPEPTGLDFDDEDEENGTTNNTIRRAYYAFDILAETYLYRKDVAFFTILVDDDHDDGGGGGICYDKNKEEEDGGSVYVLTILPPLPNINRHHQSTTTTITKRWIGFPDENTTPTVWNPHHVFATTNNTTTKANGPSTTTTPLVATNMANLTMAQFLIVQTTPSILYFDLDRYSAAIGMSFPFYRRVHLVLFIDLHSPRSIRQERQQQTLEGQELLFQPSVEFEAKYKRIVRMMKIAALEHRKIRPMEDVVFLIVPSTAIRVMKTFGINIWSEMDLSCTSSKEKCTLPENGIPILPMAMLTSRREIHPTMMKYYLHSDDLLSPQYNNNDDGNNGDVGGRRRKNPLSTLLSNYYASTTTDSNGYEDYENSNDDDNEETINAEQKKRKERGIMVPPPTFKSEPTPKNRTLSSGVQIATGHTFHSMVTKSTTHHNFVQFYSPTCGHCKRFSIVWNNLARYIRHLNWDDRISVVKLDMTKNEVAVEGVDVRNFPAVYFFPRKRKDDDDDAKNRRRQQRRPIELTVKGDGYRDGYRESNVGGISDAVDVLEWMIGLEGVFEEGELESLAAFAAGAG